mgnify:CR=1 FL=1
MKDIVVQEVNKAYGEVQALQDISLHIDEGELFGLIGPDGAGKTSLFRILTLCCWRIAVRVGLRTGCRTRL